MDQLMSYLEACEEKLLKNYKQMIKATHSVKVAVERDKEDIT